MADIIKRFFVLIVGLGVLGLADFAAADRFQPMPLVNGKSNKHLKVRFVTYDGDTNGQMVIEVKNVSKGKQSFTANGMYFVPKGKPEEAPQRLGASGPILEIVRGKVSKKSVTKLDVKPGETKRLRLEVFCIDSHRSSPNRKTKFVVAKKVLPKKLRRELRDTNRAVYRKHKGKLKAAKSAVQSNMWKVRNKKWIKLEGERKNEKAKPRPRRQRIDRNRAPRTKSPQRQRNRKSQR